MATAMGRAAPDGFGARLQHAELLRRHHANTRRVGVLDLHAIDRHVAPARCRVARQHDPSGDVRASVFAGVDDHRHLAQVRVGASADHLLRRRRAVERGDRHATPPAAAW